jgi:hypothetical protein
VILLGIDIGLTGAVAAISQQGARIVDLPTIAVPGVGMVRSRLSGRGLRDILLDLVPPGCVALALIEDVHTMPGSRNSPQAQGSLMRSRGIVEAALDIAGIETRVVQPATWKRRFGLIGQDKRASVPLAAKLYPEAGHMLKRVKDHNRGDALLIAHFGRTFV